MSIKKPLTAHNNGTEIKVIPAHQLFVDDGYQRVSQASARAKRIMGKFNWEYVHTFLVAPRGRDKYACVDGGHRLEAIAQLFPGFLDADDKPICLRCEVLKKSPKRGGRYVHEAMSFLGAQDEQRAPNANDAFKARLYAGVRAAVRTFNIAKKHGIDIRFKKPGERFILDRNETRHGGVFYWAYEHLGEQGYTFMVELLTEYTRDDDSGDIESKALQGTFIRGLASFLKTTDMSVKQILKALPYSDFAAIIVDNAWQKSRSGFQRPQAVSDEIKNSLLNGHRLAVAA